MAKGHGRKKLHRYRFTYVYDLAGDACCVGHDGFLSGDGV